MTMLDDLYQDVILEHSRKPSNFRLLADANRSAEGFNPLCGDKVSVGLRVDDSGVISDVGFQGRGCAISKASASMMTESIKDKSVADARKIFESFRSMVTRAPGEEFEGGDELEDLEMLAGVSEFPIRVKCATLAWHTLVAALNEQDEAVKTE
jgi:nitrogen fixation NifU-like protein